MTDGKIEKFTRIQPMTTTGAGVEGVTPFAKMSLGTLTVKQTDGESGGLKCADIFTL